MPVSPVNDEEPLHGSVDADGGPVQVLSSAPKTIRPLFGLFL